MNAAAAAIRARWSERVQAIPKGAHGRPAAIKRYNDACARLERLERYPEQPAPLSGGGAAVAARL